MESYKNKSKIATLLSFIAAFIVYVGKDEIAKLLPAEYAWHTAEDLLCRSSAQNDLRPCTHERQAARSNP